MDSHDLTSEQLDKLSRKAVEMTAWLHALKQRMDQRAFSPEDDLYCRVREAFDRVQHLRMTLHYLAVEKGRQG